MGEQAKTLASVLSSLHAIVLGDADAIVVETSSGPRVYTLRDAGEPYRELVERMPSAAVVLDADHTILYCNGGLTRLLGREGLEGKDLLDVVAIDHKSRAKTLLAAAASDRFDTEMALVKVDGADTRVRASAAPMTFDGQPCIALVVTALDEIEALRESEERNRLLVEQAVDGIFLSDADGHYVEVNSAGHRMLGYTREEILSRTLADLLVPDETGQIGLVAELAAGEITRSDWRFRRKDGSDFVGEFVGRRLPDGHMLGILRDITERKKLEEHVDFLMAEVNHRSKNLLNLVSSIATLSAKYADPVTFATNLSKRISALAACQDLHLRGERKGVDIAELVQAQLSPFHELFDSRVLIAGPAARLKPSAAQAIGMSLHELATNAAKYGALSNGEGRVRICWEIATRDETPTFSINWLEEGGPKVTTPTRKGFGQKVIVSMAQNAVSGKVDLEFRETGLFWNLQSAAEYTLDC